MDEIEDKLKMLEQKYLQLVAEFEAMKDINTHMESTNDVLSVALEYYKLRYERIIDYLRKNNYDKLNDILKIT